MSGSSTSSSKNGQSLGLFLAKACAFVAIFVLAALAGSVVFDHTVDWRARQKPNERLFWDQRTDQADVIFLGDSVFASSYIDSPQEGFASLVHQMTGERIFNGALDGADPPDFLQSSELLVENGTRNATVILDVMPNRFLSFRYPAPAGGNYPGRFDRLVGHDPVSRLIVAVRRRLLILDPDIVWNCLFPKRSFGIEPYRDRVWNRDGDLARRRFQVLEQQWEGRQVRSFDWIKEMQSILARGNNRLVIFLSPLNTALIDAYASPEKAREYRQLYVESHSVLVEYLQKEGIPYIDAGGHIGSEGFADLIHVNARGNRDFAELISGYLRPSPVATPALTAGHPGSPNESVARNESPHGNRGNRPADSSAGTQGETGKPEEQ